MLFWKRLRSAWNIVRNKEGYLLVHGPLPLWMQEILEREAERLNQTVEYVIFEALRRGTMEIYWRDHPKTEQEEREGSGQLPPG